MHAAEESLQQALLDAGILGLRPVVVTVVVTVMAFVPLSAPRRSALLRADCGIDGVDSD